MEKQAGNSCVQTCMGRSAVGAGLTVAWCIMWLSVKAQPTFSFYILICNFNVLYYLLPVFHKSSLSSFFYHLSTFFVTFSNTSINCLVLYCPIGFILTGLISNVLLGVLVLSILFTCPNHCNFSSSNTVNKL